MSRVKSVSSPSVILFFLFVSVGATAAAVPFWQIIAVSGTLFWGAHPAHEARQDWVTISQFFLEFIVGVCMLLMVTSLLLFRMKEIKECWKIHRRIRFYFLLTLVATAVNLSLGICGTFYVIGNRQNQGLISFTWMSRHVHVALDTIVLYGVLAGSSRCVDERPVEAKSSDALRVDASALPGSTRHNTRPSLGNGLGNGNGHRKVHSSNTSTPAPMSRLA